MADLQRRADGAQDKHGYRGDVRKCELCGQLVVSVCDSLDMGEAVTCHYEPATEDETAKRIAELEAELAALRKDAAVGRAIRKYTADVGEFDFAFYGGKYHVYVEKGGVITEVADGDSPYAALAAAGLMEEEVSE